MKTKKLTLLLIFTLFLYFGSSITHSEDTNKKTYIGFFATWCPHCKSEMPIIEKFYKNYKDYFNINLNITDGKKFQNNYTVPQDISGNITYESVTGEECKYIPSYVILDENKKIIEKECGAKLTFEELEERLIDEKDRKEDLEEIKEEIDNDEVNNKTDIPIPANANNKKIITANNDIKTEEGLLEEETKNLEENTKNAQILADSGIISNKKHNPKEYKINSKITRREVLKIIINLSSKELNKTCEGKFSDLNNKDWGCKYAETALDNNMIAKNNTFHPSKNISKIEALKMIMNAKNIEKSESNSKKLKSDWKVLYVKKANELGITKTFSDFETEASRGFIFDIGVKVLDT